VVESAALQPKQFVWMASAANRAFRAAMYAARRGTTAAAARYAAQRGTFAAMENAAPRPRQFAWPEGAAIPALCVPENAVVTTNIASMANVKKS
jgi:hypothetical protein